MTIYYSTCWITTLFWKHIFFFQRHLPKNKLSKRKERKERKEERNRKKDKAIKWLALCWMTMSSPPNIKSLGWDNVLCNRCTRAVQGNRVFCYWASLYLCNSNVNHSAAPLRMATTISPRISLWKGQQRRKARMTSNCIKHLKPRSQDIRSTMKEKAFIWWRIYYYLRRYSSFDELDNLGLKW